VATAAPSKSIVIEDEATKLPPVIVTVVPTVPLDGLTEIVAVDTVKENEPELPLVSVPTTN